MIKLFTGRLQPLPPAGLLNMTKRVNIIGRPNILILKIFPDPVAAMHHPRRRDTFSNKIPVHSNNFRLKPDGIRAMEQAPDPKLRSVFSASKPRSSRPEARPDFHDALTR